ncbi:MULTISPECIES: GNAT family N-acetyltransferase [unclassified Leifsonia]|uniref:GNAT family N-acetyltransferase n=1 Tax=unclassified Leifsonia TaxID=2663824 RepID=UPI0006F9E733|nr:MULTISPECIES: GNAT family N-acetyltransferase [unclassified Leifsonia]KQX05442.1 acetyltransferase [Leifsonia sp. Root1293]KRA09075.1 acetyltransferase [Leifsonia sp. Root60]
MTVSIRTATTADADTLAELAAATFALACPPHTTAEAIAAFIAAHLSRDSFDAHLSDPSRVLLIAEQQSATDPASVAVGYTMLVFAEPTDVAVAAAIGIRPTVELSKFYTRASTHGTGVSGPLMAATLVAAGEREARGAWLGVNQENARAIRFYEKSGFARVGTKHFLVGDRHEDDFVLERRLP